MPNDFNNITSFIDGTVPSKGSENIDGIAQIIDTGASVANNVDTQDTFGTDRSFGIISSQRGN